MVRLAEAVTTREVTAALAEALPDVVRGDACAVYRLPPKAEVEVTARAPDAFLRAYEESGRPDDPVLQAARKLGRPTDSSQLPDGVVWAESAAHEVLRDAGLGHSLEAPLLGDAGELIGTLNVARRVHETGFDGADRSRLRVLSQHAGPALRRAECVATLERRAGLLEHGLDQIGQPLVLTDLSGQLVYANRSARRRYGRSSTDSVSVVAAPAVSEGIRALRDGAKRVHLSGDQAPTPRASAGPLRSSWQGHGGPSTNASSAPEADLRADDPWRLARVPAGLCVKSVLVSSDEAVLSFIYNRGDTLAEPLPAWYLLSPREQSMTQMVSEGLTTREIAARAFVTENTVKQHLKRIFAKVGVHTRAQLVQTVWSQSGAARSTG